MSYIRLNTVIEPAAPATNKVVLFAGTDKVLKTKDDAGLVTPLSAAPGVSILSTTGSIATLPIPPGSGTLVVQMVNTSPATIHGIAPGLPGQQLTIYQQGAGSGGTWLAHASASAGATNQRLVNFATSAPTPLSPGCGAAIYHYDAVNGFWRLDAHEQGAWITPPYSAANFTGSAGTWTVDAGDIATMRYRLSGRTITLAYVLTTTSVSAGGADLRMGSGVWGGFVSAQTMSNGLALASDNGTTVAARHAVTAGGSTLFLNRNDNLSWGAAVNTSYLQGQIAFEVN